ncbi:MAG: Beta-hexosaminidase [candidate division BRC1 bacterium ADurb.Bin183]|nr:MAG: Beta-hexosaminidase [candidate division BRC1 bacterium ADurb.Bin183]
MKNICSRWLILILIFLTMISCSMPKKTPKNTPKKTYLVEDVGAMHFYYGHGAGVSLTVHGIPVFNGTSLWAVKPGWYGHYYSAGDDPNILTDAKIEPWQGGKKITLIHKGLPGLRTEGTPPFEAKETFTLLPDNTYSATLEFIFHKDEPVWLQWGVGDFNPSPIIGRSFTAQYEKEKREGIIPVLARFVSVEDSTVARGFNKLLVDSRMGPIEIESDAQTGIIFFDYRKSVHADINKPIFWMGVLDREFEPQKPHTFFVTMRFPKAPRFESQAAENISLAPKIANTNSAKVPSWGRDYIIPKPKQLKWTQALMPLSASTRIYISKNPGAGVEKAARFLLKDLRDIYGIEPQVARDDAPADGSNAIVLGEQNRYLFPAAQCAKFGLPLPAHDDGYSLMVDENRAYVAAQTEKGVFYGVTTLVQMVCLKPEGAYLRGAEIVDYPTLNFRGIHCLTGKGKGAEIARAVRELMARFKINTLCWETEYIIWDSHPELAHPQYGMEKADARKVIEAADENMIEIIPLIQSLGHSEWMFVGGQNLELAEDPEKPYHSCPTNPDAYKLVFDVYQEAVDLFKPRIFNIGHDEVTGSGRFPYRSQSSGKTITQLIIDDINIYHDWFTQRGIKVMLWGDMFLHQTEATDAHNAESPAEAKARRAGLPRDVIIADWHYGFAEPEDFISLKLWKDEGLAAIGAGWDSPDNIRNLAKACDIYGAFGYLQTTWAGFNFAITGNEPAWRQYWSYILAAYYSWSGDTAPDDKLPFRANVVFSDIWSGVKPDVEQKKGFFVDLSAIANRSLGGVSEDGGWMGLGTDIDLSALPKGENLFGNIMFDIPDNKNGCAAFLLASKFNPAGEYPKSVELAFEPVTASELHFLMNSSSRTVDGREMGAIIINYEDGFASRLPLAYGKNVFFATDFRLGQNVRIAWEGKAKSGETVRAWDLVWRNPSPHQKIAKISLESANSEAAPVILAVTGVH